MSSGFYAQHYSIGKGGLCTTERALLLGLVTMQFHNTYGVAGTGHQNETTVASGMKDVATSEDSTDLNGTYNAKQSELCSFAVINASLVAAFFLLVQLCHTCSRGRWEAAFTL